MSDNLGTLYVVATPIGNLADISERAINILSSVDLCAVEDTRVTSRLLAHKSLKTKLISYHDHSTEKKIGNLIELILSGLDIALVSDAGTPSISDPGYSLVRRALDNGVKVVPIPGASAVTSIISVAGIPSEKFIFQGFPPRKGRKRILLLQELRDETKASIFFESGMRIKGLLEDINTLDPERRLVLGREITKLHEVIYRGTSNEVLKCLERDNFGKKGEFVLLIEGSNLLEKKSSKLTKDELRILEVLLNKLSKKEVLNIAPDLFNIKKNDLYKLILERYSK
jgi:16S rRNA (cytidine1402-2'-O)-methyltransferase|tara:strand:+ start:729 stop:1580 length:852 start_codon:yes stop_codon:yes gene_type:complete